MSSSKGTFIIGNLLKVTNKKTKYVFLKLPWDTGLSSKSCPIVSFYPLIVRDPLDSPLLSIR